jgi:hypothetical protein
MTGDKEMFLSLEKEIDGSISFGNVMQEHRQQARVAGQARRLGIISESQMLGVTVNILELIGKTKEDQMLGGGMIMSDLGVSLRVLNVTELR